MQAQENLYVAGVHLKAGRSLMTFKATTESFEDVTLTIYDKCLTETSSKQKQRTIIFDFDVKFAFTLNPICLTFEKGLEKSTYSLKSENDLMAIRDILRGKLNQRGFHQQFKPKKKIGKGNFASVYLAEKLQNGKDYAVKAFSKQAAYSEDKGKECLIKEIEIMRSLNHKNLMKLHQVFQSQNSLYIVVQLLSGGQLYDKIKAKYKFKQQETKQIIYSILTGLQSMHREKIMHRDLKPENLIFRNSDSFDCVIADFGLAEFCNADEYLFVRCGTPGYVAPEVINIKDMKMKYDPICDLFSLGLIFHILLLGTSAFPGKTYNEVLAQNRASNITFDGDEYKKIPPDALALLQKLLKKSPIERISADKALNHPYFNNMAEEMDIEDDRQMIEENKKSSVMGSPLLTTANNARKADKSIKKDSCVDFKMGKQNVLTGKTDTVADTGSTNGSVNKRFESLVYQPKASKFTAKK